MYNIVEMSDIIGHVFFKVYQEEDTIIFEKPRNGQKAKQKGYKLEHIQDCCEYVYIADICGSLSDLEGVPILRAEEITDSGETEDGTYTYTFYKFATIKGYVDIRFNGESNGYYSEEVSLIKL